MIKNMDKFTEQHKVYIQLIQSMEPLFISIYCTPDPFSYIKNQSNHNLLFSSSSHRCAVSRYISIGTYDTDTMIIGKLLTSKIETFKIATEPHGWYNKYYNDCAYTKLNKLGYDINFNKHFNHGVEIRFFDHIECSKTIKEILEFLIYLGDYAISKSKTIINPINCME